MPLFLKSKERGDFSSLKYDLIVYNSPLLDEPGLICESKENVEMHHLKHFKDTKDKAAATLKVMSKIRRKAIAFAVYVT